MLGLLLIPVWMFIGAAFPPADRFVEGSPSTTVGEAVAWILMWVAFLAGAARLIVAMSFENNAVHGRSAGGQETGKFGSKKENAALPSGDAFRGVKAGKWKTTDELLDPVYRNRRTFGEL